MSDISKFFKKAIVPTVCLLLLVTPFFWFSYGKLDLGGDSSRLYFYDPWSWLINISAYSNNVLSGFGIDNPNFMIAPFLVLLAILKLILFNQPYLLNCLFSGLLLSGGFLFTYLSILEIINLNKESEKSKKYSKYAIYSSVIGALFFALSPLIIYEWQKTSYYFNFILVFPLIFYLFAKYINTERNRYIIIAVIVTFVFAVNFSFYTSPWFFAFFPFVFLFFIFYSIIAQKFKRFLWGLSLFLVLFLLVQAFQLIPQINNVLNTNNPNSQVIFSNEGKLGRGLGYFLSVQPYVRLIYNILNQPQYDISIAFNHNTKDTIFQYGIKYQYIFSVYILIVAFSLLVVKKIETKKTQMVFFATLALFLLLLFLVTANLGSPILNSYKSLFSIPGFSMFRSFYTKFSFPFVFFYAILLSLSLFYISKLLKKKIFVLYIFLVLIIVFNGWPLISGKITNGVLWQSKNVKIPIEIDDSYLLFLDSLKNKKIDGKFLSFPLTNEQYQLLKGKNDGAYFGPSSISILGGKNDFNGLGSFMNFREEVVKALREKNFDLLRFYFSAFNIKYVIHNSDNYIYDNFPAYPYTAELKDIFPNQSSIKDFIGKLGYKEIEKIGQFGIYGNELFLPHFYIPDEVIVLSDLPNSFSDTLMSSGNELNPAVYFGQNQNKALKNAQNINLTDDKPVLEFKKINPAKYRVRIHTIDDASLVVFSDFFDKGWKMYASEQQKNNKDLKEALQDYKILDGNEDVQAPKETLEDFINQGIISDLGDGKIKTIQHKEFENEKRKMKHEEEYTVDFISKNFQGTIQNDNLPKGSIFETWFKKPIENGENHLMANGYANSWIIDPQKICETEGSKCIKNPDGTYNMELVVEFWPQRLFYWGSIISGLTLLGSLSYLTLIFIRNRKKANNKLA